MKSEKGEKLIEGALTSVVLLVYLLLIYSVFLEIVCKLKLN